MKIWNRIGVLMAVGALLLGSRALASTYTLHADFDGLQEVPPNNTPAFGSADATFDDTTGAFTINAGTGVYQDLLGGATSVSLQDAAIGFNGPIILNLTLDTPGASTGTFSGGGTVTNAGQIADIIADNSYINIRSSVFPSGEIRGQLFVTPEPASLGLLGVGAFAFLARRRRA